jgi:DNA-binding NarL/FixJ family response regulator
MSLKIFIVEDHPIMRYTLSNFIQNKLGLEVSGVAAAGMEALKRLAEVETDIVLIDVLLPGMSGFDLVKQLQERKPGLPCLMLSGHGEITYVQHALRIGARGYVLKGNPPEIREAIAIVMAGGTYLSPVLQANLSGAGG